MSWDRSMLCKPWRMPLSKINWHMPFCFCGPRGVGKTSCARILAKTVNCLNSGQTGEACGTCDHCKIFAEQQTFNIIELDAASYNSVDHIRSLNDQVRFQPQQGQYKVFIIDEVHMLSQSAFNAFLKTLEESRHLMRYLYWPLLKSIKSCPPFFLAVKFLILSEFLFLK